VKTPSMLRRERNDKLLRSLCWACTVLGLVIIALAVLSL